MNARKLIMICTVIAAAMSVLAFSTHVFTVQAEEKPVHTYIGAEKCKTCHKSEKKGNQYGEWEKSEHAKAFDVLASDEAKALAATMNIADPQKDQKCFKCHLTEAGLAPELLDAAYAKDKGIQCETCHGPGSDYKKISTMKDRQKAIDAGLIIPDGKLCRTCHNAESPSYKGFCFKLNFARVAHPNPENKNVRELVCDCPKDENGKCTDLCKDACNAEVKF